MMKYKILLSIIIIFALIQVTTIYAKNTNDDIISLRAGGGGGGSGGSSGSASSSSTHSSGNESSYCSYDNLLFCMIRKFFTWTCFCFVLFFTTIMLYLKVLRSSFNSKRYLRMISKKDSSWKYKKIEKQVMNTFYIVQNAWTNMDMTSAKEYMEEALYENFQSKLEWMEIGNKRNILKRIRLINLKPVSVHDDLDDHQDLIWFYIHGMMVDYTIDTKTNKKIEGNHFVRIPFIEFWKFTRKGDRWVLSKIIQSNEKDQIHFQ